MKNYYVVLEGKNPGVYETWDQCKEQVDGFSGAKFKKIKANTSQEAMSIMLSEYQVSEKPNEIVKSNGKIQPGFLSVDGASDGSSCEFQAVWVDTKKLAFASKKFVGGTNNIAEFLGLVLACKHLKDKNLPINIYTDSVTAMAWFRNKKANTTASANGKMTAELENLIQKSEKFLIENEELLKTAKILKWETKEWGEIPADYGRK